VWRSAKSGLSIGSFLSCHVLLLFELLFFAGGLLPMEVTFSLNEMSCSKIIYQQINEERDKNSFIKMKSGLCCFQDNLCLAFAPMKQ
jgi:hypothetical protein